MNETVRSERKYFKIISGEPAFLTILDEKNPKDVEWYKKLDESPEVMKWMKGEGELPGGLLTRKQIEYVISEHGKKWLLYAISGKNKELEGWIQMWPEDDEIKRRTRKKFSSKLPINNTLLEVSYARYNDHKKPGREKEKGLISSGMRQICFMIGSKKERNRKPKFSIVAYTDPENVPSEKVLEKSGFKMIGKIKYEPDSEKEDNCWVLDWKKLLGYYSKETGHHKPA